MSPQINLEKVAVDIGQKMILKYNLWWCFEHVAATMFKLIWSFAKNQFIQKKLLKSTPSKILSFYWRLLPNKFWVITFAFNLKVESERYCVNIIDLTLYMIG